MVKYMNRESSRDIREGSKSNNWYVGETYPKKKKIDLWAKATTNNFK